MDIEKETTFCEVANVFRDSDPMSERPQEDCWTYLRCERQSSSLFATPELVDFVFCLARDLGLSSETALLALDVFLVFVSKHTQQLAEVAFPGDGSPASAELHWDALIHRVSGQTALRMVSCIQLAAKAGSCSQMVSVTRARHVLQCLGLNYSIQSLRASERRVFTAIDYHVPLASSTDYLERFIWSLRDRFTKSELDVVYQAAIRVMQVASILQQQAFKHLFHMTTQRWQPTKQERLIMRMVARDRLFLACAAVSCAGALALGRRWTGAVVTLSALAGIPSADVEGLAGILVQLCIGG